MLTSGITDTWEQIRAALQAMLPEASFHTWFCNAHLESFDGSTLVIGAANRFVKAWLENNYLGVIAEAARTTLGVAVEVNIVLSREQYKKHLEESTAAASNPDAAKAASLSVGGLSPDGLRREVAFENLPLFQKSRGSSFADFVCGRCNSFAYHAAMKIVDAPGTFSPLYLFGGHGLGKTHLLHAVCREASEKNPAGKIICLSADAFVQAFTTAYMDHHVQDFRLRFERCDLLAIDDFQNFAAGKKSASQKELASILDHLCHRGKQVILAGDRVGHELIGLDPMLASRLSSGLQVRLDPLDAETRLAIIRKKGEEFSPELASFLAARASGSVREIEGIIKTLSAMSAVTGQPVDCDQAAQLLAPQAQTIPAIAEIAAAVSASFGVTVTELRGKKRHATVSDARRIAVRLSRQLGEASLSEIGAYFGNRTHSTILSLLRTSCGEASPVLQEKLRTVLAKLGCRRDCAEFLTEQSTIFTISPESPASGEQTPEKGQK